MAISRLRHHQSRPRAQAEALLSWYDRHARALPWRAKPGETTEPYRVWLSEVMLQQTVVKAVIPYFHRFTERWPGVEALAAASDEEVLAAWAGLGYYARARKMMACAREIIACHGGIFPDDEAELVQLPGIGPYTAAAIAAIAFGRKAVVVDGNVERVIARLYRIETPLPAAKKLIGEKAALLTPQMRPGDYAQAMMDLGATICTPRNPACALCPLAVHCAARLAGDAESFPRKITKAKKPQRRGQVFVLRRKADILLTRRDNRGLLGGMAIFPTSGWIEGNALDGQIPPLLPDGLDWQQVGIGVKHVFTHFTLYLDVMTATVDATTSAPPGTWWWPAEQIRQAGLPSLMRKVAALAGIDG